MSDSMKGKGSAGAPAKVRIDVMSLGIYDGKELKRNPGIIDSRFDAFRLPSRVGNQLHYPKRTP